MKVVIATAIGRLDDGRDTVLFPSRSDAAVHGKDWDYYPYELAYLSSLLKREGYPDTVLVDGCREKLNAAAYIPRLVDLRPDVLVMELTEMTYKSSTRVAQAVKEATGARLILTGPHGMYKPKEAHADGWDEVIFGEYEAKVLALLNGAALPIGYIDLDWLPWPEDDDISRIWYREAQDPLPGMVQTYPTRGCPMSCTFCVVPMYYGGHGSTSKSHRVRDPENVCDEIEYLAHKYAGQFNGCFFNEENHSTNTDWLAQFAETLIRRGLNKYAYDAMSGYWTYTEELVKLMARAGYKQIRIGIESIDPAVWKAVHKAAPVERIERFMEWCKAAGVDVMGTFQMGAPGSTPQSDQRTRAKIREWQHNGLMRRIQVSTTQAHPGTPLYEMALEQGALMSDDFEQYDYYTRNLRWQV